MLVHYSHVCNLHLYVRNLASIQDREICCYSVSCKEKENIGKSRCKGQILQALCHHAGGFAKKIKN